MYVATSFLSHHNEATDIEYQNLSMQSMARRDEESQISVPVTETLPIYPAGTNAISEDNAAAKSPTFIDKLKAQLMSYSTSSCF